MKFSCKQLNLYANSGTIGRLILLGGALATEEQLSGLGTNGHLAVANFISAIFLVNVSG